MRSSGSSSARATANPPSAPPGTRRTFALSGPSQALDPRINAVRSDIADIAMAERVFAPHYVAALRRVVARDADLRLAREPGSEVLTTLARGDAFDLLDVTGGVAWGTAVGAGLVGYLDAGALAAG